jgi:predicted transcriptional regulator
MSEKLELVAHIVSAYVAKNSLPKSDLPSLITSINSAVIGLGTPSVPPSPVLVPAVPVRSSVKSDRIACLECGKRFKTLKRHLRTDHALTPEGYRAKWSLSSDYPMVAPDYSATRSETAKRMGLGRKVENRGRRRKK